MSSEAVREFEEIGAWNVPTSTNMLPHFELVNGRQRLYVDGRPFTALAAEIPWWDLIAGRSATQKAYDYLYPAAHEMGLNTLKVPVKWSLIESKKGVYDFSYIDHVKSMAEQFRLKLVLDWFGHYASGDGTIYRNLTGDMFAPLYVIEDDEAYPRAIDADGVAHHSAISYESDAVIDRETAAFRKLMEHIKAVDSQSHTIIMIQVENEIAVFGADRQNRKLWRDHSSTSNEIFAQRGFSDDLKYSAWRLSSNWIRRIADAGAKAYPLPLFHNFVGGKLAGWMVGGAPGEDVMTYLENCPRIMFVGLNYYANPGASADELRKTLAQYLVGRNLLAVTEMNSGPDPVAPRLTYIAVGEFGSPIVAPWALSVSYPGTPAPYVRKDGSLANGAFALRDAYSSISKALPQISYYANTDRLTVFTSNLPGQKFAHTEDVDGVKVTVKGEDNGQAILIRPTNHDLVFIGYGTEIVLQDDMFQWPTIQRIRIEKGYWTGNRWNRDGEPTYGFNQSDKSLYIGLETPQAVRVSW